VELALAMIACVSAVKYGEFAANLGVLLLGCSSGEL